nr:RNA-directed DNA polymerase, eukaryota [Tanacetum cinerariifolium]
MHENDTAHKDVNSCKKREAGSHSEDPFNIYGILDGQKNNVCNSCSDEPKFPPGFTPDNNDQEKNMEENIKDTTKRVQSLSNKLNDRCSNRRFSLQRSMNSHSRKSKVGGSILDLMDELVTVGQTMGYNMAEKVSTCDSFVALMGTWAPTFSKLLIIFVYAPQELNERRDLWDYLCTFIDRWEGDTVIMSDFNKVRSKHERKINIQQNLLEVDKFIDQGKSNDEIFIKRITLLNDLQEFNNSNAMEISQKAKIRWSIEVQDLKRTITYEEVKRAVWDCGTNKSPGPDGFSFEFCHKYWTTIDDDVFQAVKDSFVNGHFPRGCLKINLYKSKLMGIGVSSNVVAAAAFDWLLYFNCSFQLSWREGEVALKVLYKRLYALDMCKSISVAEKISHPSLSHSFCRMPRDRWCWYLEGSQEFLVKSSRILIDNTILLKAEVPTRWLRVVPIKVNVHAWTVYLDNLPTRANLSLRGMDIT